MLRSTVRLELLLDELDLQALEDHTSYSGDRGEQTDDETTAIQLQQILVANGQPLSLRTILRSRQSLGWTFRGSAYCQLIRDANKLKRLAWAKEHLYQALDDGFKEYVWTDGASFQLETHRRFCCRKEGRQARPKPRPKHPTKVHVWAGISWNGATDIIIFEGIMDRHGFVSILEKGLKSFVQRTPGPVLFMQDNDPKHTSLLAREWLEKEGIEWWKTPAESPDLNPIENLWHEAKEYLRREVKPKVKDELLNGLKEFWKTVDVAKCRKYIRHLRKVVPKVIDLDGGPTGY